MKTRKKKSHILVNIATHGDELIGFAVKKSLEKLGISKGELRFNVANEKAHKHGKRFIDQDLNRCFPGKATGNHEQRLAARLMPKIKAADIVIDIHSTTTQLKDTLIVTKLDDQTRKIIAAVQPTYALCMRISKDNALISNAKVGIAFEYGKDTDKRVIAKTARDIKKILDYSRTHDRDSKQGTKTIFFEVRKSFPKMKGAMLSREISNYKRVRKGQVVATFKGREIRAKEDFYPILFGNSNYEGIFGFIGKLL